MSSSTTSVNRPLEVQTAPSEAGVATHTKRSSRLNDFMSRSRTSSLPPRPHTSSGPQSPSSSLQKLNIKLGNLKGKGRDQAEGDPTLPARAARSSVSVAADPFAANPAPSASFVPYSHSATTLSPTKGPSHLTMRPATADSDTIHSGSFSPPTSPVSSTHMSHSPATPVRRRGSILVAASDALSSFARKTPMRSLHMGGLGRQNSTKNSAYTNSQRPIVLTEVIEISESAIRASKRREEEEAERERLRDAAARALGINESDVDTSSTNSRTRQGSMDHIGVASRDEGDEDDDQQGWNDDAKTPTASSIPSLPGPLGHSRSRSGSYIPPHTLLSQTSWSPTPLSLSSSLSSQNGLPPLCSPSSRSTTPRSLSTPPTSTAPTLRVNTSNTSKINPPQDKIPSPAAEIPPFPSTPAALSPFTQLSGTMPRYYPAPSLLMFTLSRQWKNRYLVFTSPLASPSTRKPVFTSPWHDAAAQHAQDTTPSPSFLHLFKTSGTEEKEVERLEINEESVVYVAEGEVGGRKGVIKVGGCLRKKGYVYPQPPGTGVSSRTSSSSVGSADDSHEGGVVTSPNSESGGASETRTMWIVQVTPEEAQAWITAIKGSVLSQRSIRAGLGTPSSVNGLEPRGDLDVILSMRAQSLIPVSPVPLDSPSSVYGGSANRSHGGISPTQSTFTTESNHTSSAVHLSRSQSATAYSSTSTAVQTYESGGSPSVAHTNGSSSPIPRATTALKSLFTISSGRPRSPSTASLSSPASTLSEEDAHPEESFGHAGVSLMGMMRTNSYITDRPLSPTTPTQPGTPRAGTPIIPPDAFLLERKILSDPDRQLRENENDAEARQAIQPQRTENSSLGMGRPREVEDRHIIPGRVSSEGITSVALQPPPPRKRAGTVNTVTVSVSGPSELTPSLYSYSHANSSTAESLGVNFGVKNSNLLTPPLPETPHTPNTAVPQRPKDRRTTRASWSSVSTYGSGDQPSSPDETRFRRWSRRSSVPHRMSPPYPSISSPPSSPLSQDIPVPSVHHPYASENGSLSRSSSLGSGHSRVSELHVPRPFSSKRASVNSTQSWSTSSTNSPPTMINNKPLLPSSRPRSAQRVSMPPPQRPAPSSALPPTPGEGSERSTPSSSTTQLSPPTTKTFRESLILRGNKRLSSASPFLPPSVELPPRPDEPGYRPPANGHRRTSSQGTPTDTAFGGLVRSKAPLPPPSTPLPPPPETATPVTAPSSPTRSASTITQRLRILSSPPTSPPQTAPPRPPIDTPEPFFTTLSIPESPVIPAPIGEPITTLQNDPNFLSLTPLTPQRDSPVEIIPQGLSPPPRRSSRQVATPDKEKLQAEVEPPASTGLTDEFSGDDQATDSPAPPPPPEVDEFASFTLPVRSSERSAVSLVDIRI
ncbi:hypothetical protein BDW22DRAFT_1362216 [Trametopsis cervina]|nr:hypothetical protein BDW22DRAFT_1362216 [Trametopsis cervina]